MIQIQKKNGGTARLTLDGRLDDIAWENLRVKTYREAGMKAQGYGLVITLPDGSEYQVSIKRTH